jgi:hypothetical protein
MIGGTIYEPGAPAGQESAVIASVNGAPGVTYVGDPFGYGSGNAFTTLQAAPGGIPAGVGMGAGAGITGNVNSNEALFQANAGNALSLISKGLPAIGAAFPALAGVAGAIAPIAGIGAGIYGALQAMGLGEGEGLFGLDILGGDTQYFGNIPLGGPGLAEPPAQYVIKEWSRNTAAGKVQYYRVQMPNMKKPVTLGYYTAYRRWVKFKAPHLAIIGKGLPSHKQLTRLRHNLSRHSADARTILKIVSPKSLRTPKRGRR